MSVQRVAGTCLPILLLAVACAGAAPASPAPSPIVASVTRESLRITLTLEGPPRTGAASWASIRVENVGDRGIRWAAGGCGDPGGIFVDLARLYPAGRADWPEPLGHFKRIALGPGNGNNLLNLGYTAEARWGTNILCPASLGLGKLAAGDTLSMRAAWDGTYEGFPVPTGPATVEAAFPLIGVEGEVADTEYDSHAVAVSIETAVVGEGGASVLAPGLAIDAALADPVFAAWVSAGPVDRWINPDIARIGGTWQVGLFKSGAPGGPSEAYDGVVIDGTGHITAHKSG
jgi:hypothetical protein